MSNWISVKDRLPEEDEEVLVYSERKKTMVASYQGDNFISKTGGILFMLDSPCCYHNISVTHWQPLLEPPKVNE